MTRNNLPPSPLNGLYRKVECKAQSSSNIFSIKEEQRSFRVSAQHASPEPGPDSNDASAKYLKDFGTSLSARLTHVTPDIPTSTLHAKALSFKNSSMKLHQDGSEALLSRSRGSTRGNASILLCNTALNVSSRAPARAHAASSSGEHATYL